MKPALSSLTLGALLAMSSVLLAAGKPADPALGTWKLNATKSSGTSVPRSETRTYAASAKGILLTYTRVGADGKESSIKATFKYDGQDHPVTGSTDFDAVSVKRIGRNIVESIMKRGGKPVGTSTRSISADGKTLTLVTRGTDAKGQMTTATLVYDRQ